MSSCLLILSLLGQAPAAVEPTEPEEVMQEPMGQERKEAIRSVVKASQIESAEDEAFKIGKLLRCPVCQGMPIAESPSSMAQNMMKRGCASCSRRAKPAQKSSPTSKSRTVSSPCCNPSVRASTGWCGSCRSWRCLFLSLWCATTSTGQPRPSQKELAKVRVCPPRRKPTTSTCGPSVSRCGSDESRGCALRLAAVLRPFGELRAQDGSGSG